jgi:CheY-like chemotaxis protein
MTVHFPTRSILSSDDDRDDALLFEDVLAQYRTPVKLTLVTDGKRLIALLKEMQSLPDLIFLDPNVPLKNGLTCVIEIKQTGRLQQMPVVIFPLPMSSSSLTNCMPLAHLIISPNQMIILRLRMLLHKHLILPELKTASNRQGIFELSA